MRVEEFGPGSYGHGFRLHTPEDIDAAFEELVRESYRVGLREHLIR